MTTRLSPCTAAQRDSAHQESRGVHVSYPWQLRSRTRSAAVAPIIPPSARCAPCTCQPGCTGSNRGWRGQQGCWWWQQRLHRMQRRGRSRRRRHMTTSFMFTRRGKRGLIREADGTSTCRWAANTGRDVTQQASSACVIHAAWSPHAAGRMVMRAEPGRVYGIPACAAPPPSCALCCALCSWVNSSVYWTLYAARRVCVLLAIPPALCVRWQHTLDALITVPWPQPHPLHAVWHDASWERMATAVAQVEAEQRRGQRAGW